MTEHADWTKPFLHQGSTGRVIRIALVNFLLNVVTLSLWRFWGKTRVRRFLWGGITAWGDAVEYTGTGLQLFLGFLIVLAAVFLPLILVLSGLQIMVTAGAVWARALYLPVYLLLGFLAGVGIYRGQRYRLSRTVWRGIRAGLGGKAWLYGLMTLAGYLAVAVSLGWAKPWKDMWLARYVMDHTTFGDRPFHCAARAWPLLGRFALVWLVSAAALAGLAGTGYYLFAHLPHTLDRDQAQMAVSLVFAKLVLLGLPLLIPVGLAQAWYKAAFYRQLAAGTRLEDTGFAFDATGFGLVRLTLGNLLIVICSLGLLRPWASLRQFRFVCRRMAVAGLPDFDAIRQSAAAPPRTGEGLIEALDLPGAL